MTLRNSLILSDKYTPVARILHGVEDFSCKTANYFVSLTPPVVKKQQSSKPEASASEKDNLIMMTFGDPRACLVIATGAADSGDYPMAMMMCQKAIDLMSETIENFQNDVTHD